MFYNDNVETLKEFGIELKPCDLKSVSYTFAVKDPEEMRSNLEYLSTVVDKMDHNSNHSLLMIATDKLEVLKDRVAFLDEHEIPIKPRSIWNAASYGWERNKDLENDAERTMTA